VKEKKIFDDDSRSVVRKPVEAKGIDWKTSSGRPTKELDYIW
jgi:hypothetical protein